MEISVSVYYSIRMRRDKRNISSDVELHIGTILEPGPFICRSYYTMPGLRFLLVCCQRSEVRQQHPQKALCSQIVLTAEHEQPWLWGLWRADILPDRRSEYVDMLEASRQRSKRESLLVAITWAAKRTILDRTLLEPHVMTFLGIPLMKPAVLQLL